MERLQKVIAAAGLASRRKAEDLILEGKVKVDGQVIKTLGYKVDKSAKIEVNGRPISKEEKVYYVINKPIKVLSSVQVGRSRKVIVDYIDTKERIFPVGRLDYNTSGLLILTNDGDFANELIHPRYHIKKTYDVTIKGLLTTDIIKQIEAGIIIENKKTLPSKVMVINKDFENKVTNFRITIMEGRNRQIRKMMEYFNFTVTKLNRRQIGFLTLKGLNIGEYRRLKPFEIKRLKSLANSNIDIE